MTQPKTERILEDAELVATYLRALVDKGVPMTAAVQLAGNYLSAHQMIRASKDEPREPWQEGQSP